MKTKLTAKAKKILLKAAKSISENPLNVDMAVFIEHNSTVAPCGTVGCIAAWICAHGEVKNLRRLKEPWDSGAIADRAAKILGLSTDQLSTLFYVEDWPEKFSNRYVRIWIMKSVINLMGDHEKQKIQVLRLQANIVAQRIKEFTKAKI